MIKTTWLMTTEWKAKPGYDEQIEVILVDKSKDNNSNHTCMEQIYQHISGLHFLY
jgi:hypothetical protein